MSYLLSLVQESACLKNYMRRILQNKRTGIYINFVFGFCNCTIEWFFKGMKYL